MDKKQNNITLYLASTPLLVLYALTYPTGYSLESFQEFCSLLQDEILAKTQYGRVHIEFGLESLRKTLNDNNDLFHPDARGAVHLHENPRLNQIVKLLPQDIVETVKSAAAMQHERKSSSF